MHNSQNMFVRLKTNKQKCKCTESIYCLLSNFILVLQEYKPVFILVNNSVTGYASSMQWISNSMKFQKAQDLKTFRSFFKKVYLSTKCTFSGKRSENDFVMRSIHLENVHHCLPTTHRRNYCGLRTKLVCSVSKFILPLLKRVKNSNNKEPGTNYLKLVENQDTLTYPHSQLLPDLKVYIVTIPTEHNSS